MIVSGWLASLIFILLSLAIFGLLVFLYFRFAKKTHPLLDRFVIILSLVVGFIFWMFSNSLQNPIAEISTRGVKEYVAICGSTYTASNGKEYEIVRENYFEHLVINVTNEDFVLDYVSYGVSIDFGTVTLFPAGGFEYMSSVPDYMPWETPPNEVESSIPMSMRLWIRRPEPDDQYTHE